MERGANGELEGLDGDEGEEGGAGWDIEADDLDLPPDLVQPTANELFFIFKRIWIMLWVEM